MVDSHDCTNSLRDCVLRGLVWQQFGHLCRRQVLQDADSDESLHR